MGYTAHAFQSLRKLRTRRISAIDAVDGSTTYRGWEDLVGTLRAIAAMEPAERITLHANDPSVLVNPHDHFDHRMAGRLALDVERTQHVPTFYYLGYALATRDDNLPPAAVQLKTALFRAYDSVMIAANPRWSAFAEHRTFYAECLRRTYSRRFSRPSDGSRSPIARMR
jgi:LmbE family N-acetylglucosaminyl deacetylase